MTAILDTSFLVSLIARASALLDRYADLNLDFADACAVALAERLNVRRLLTLDRRHFAAVRPRHSPAFDVLPS
jgi:predicted nucleic acid-binding protein